ncbi:hypothetical protein FSP39_013709 [Pinctada imbricata]|uniref:G-protein coupled receptors family 1 profile domain-containing protein n=1 Tax=Pinctada imbricata TaxID=66713 RepID=A0AA88XRC8_PINIB|nr:hypothetical protein FSP39_013709 [Pinctada imbricata]
MRWKQIQAILYPEPDSPKNPAIVIPACFHSTFPDDCQIAWGEKVILPWIHKHFLDMYGRNMSGNYPEGQVLPNYYNSYPNSFGPIRNNIEKFLYPALLILAVIGSLPCIVILLKFSHSVWSTCLYLAILLFVNLVKLFLHCGNDWYYALHEKDIFIELQVTSNSICKVSSFLTGFALYMASWTMVASVIELLIMVRFPSRLYQMCTRDRANSVVLLITVLLTFINLHYFWTWALTMPEDMMEFKDAGPVCHTNKLDQTSEDFNDNIAPVINFLLVKLIPCIIVCVCLIIVIITNYKRRKQLNDETESLLGKYFMDPSAMFEMQKVTIAIAIWFLLVHSYGIVIDLVSKFTDLPYNVLDVLDFAQHFLRYLFYSLEPWLFFLLSKKVRYVIDTILQNHFLEN